MKRIILLAVLTVLATCEAPRDEAAVAGDNAVIVEAPVLEAARNRPCETGDDDGIGGTGCEPTH